MEQVRLLWDPAGFDLDSLGDKQLLRITDGDTPYVSFSIRMLSIDAPEVHYSGTQDPAAHDARLKDLGDAIEGGRVAIDAGLAAHLLPRLQSGRAGTLQKRQGEAARAGFQALLDEKLKGPRGTRPLFLRAANEHFDAYGRLLAYIAPHYSKEERARLPAASRATFNLLLVQAGLAAAFPIYRAFRNTPISSYYRTPRARPSRRAAGSGPIPMCSPVTNSACATSCGSASIYRNRSNNASVAGSSGTAWT